MSIRPVVALMLGRAGSSLPEKNIRMVANRPLLQWAGVSAQEAKLDFYFVTSDSQKILDAAKAVGYDAIERPDSLASDTARGCDVIAHAVEKISRRIGTGSFDIVMQHANSVMYFGEKIQAALKVLRSNPLATSVVPCYQVSDLHPYRQMRLDEEGFLKTFVTVPSGTSSNRQELPQSFALNHDFWVLRSENCSNESPSYRGSSPWPCLGPKPLPLFGDRTNDVHNEQDIEDVKEWLRRERNAV